MKNLRLKFAGLCLGVLALVGCETSDLPFVDKPIILGCPNFFVLEDAATLTQFRDGPGRDITDILVNAEMGEIRLGCLSKVDNDTNSGTLELDLSPIILAEMGAANVDSNAILPYFVIITDPDKNILYREELDMNISFEEIERAWSTGLRRPHSSCQSRLTFAPNTILSMLVLS